MMAAAVLATVLVVGLYPLWAVVALGLDAATDWTAKRRVRVLTLIALFLLNEILGMLGLLAAWVATGFGWQMHSARSYRFHGWLHGWWTSNIMRVTERTLDTEIRITGAELIDPSPVIIIQRHICLLDAVMPSALLAHGRRDAPRHVLMRELRFDPCIDTLGFRTPNHFIDRASGNPREIEAIKAVGATIAPGGSGVIFPEGGFRTEERFEKVVASITRNNPRLAHRAGRYRHVMPPRVTGLRALLDTAPGVDVVAIAHVGFEGMGSIVEIIREAPIGRPVNVELRRIPRSSIPDDPQLFEDWLFDVYDWIDDFVEADLTGHARQLKAS